MATCTTSSNTLNDVNTRPITEQSNKTVTILDRGPNHVIAMKPSAVLCHHDSWAGSRKKKLKVGEEPEIPMLQRVRDAIANIDCENMINQSGADDDIDHNDDIDDYDNIIYGKIRRKINLVHRLDRGTSGALLFAFADDVDDVLDVDDDDDAATKEKTVDDPYIGRIEKKNITKNEFIQKNKDSHHNCQKREKKKGATATLQEEMGKSTCIKTYVALVRGEGVLRGEDLKKKGWFEVNHPIKDVKGRVNDATTLFRFVAGQAEPQDDDDNEQIRIMQPRMSLVLARPQTGRWHQIRKHLNYLSHHILGDGSHGCSKTNKEWKMKRNLKDERIFLHLARLQIPPTKFTPNGIDCSCPLPLDMLGVLRIYAPDVLDQAVPSLESEGILINEPEKKYEVGSYTIPDALLKAMEMARIEDKGR
mmetsp:Transcript_2539/g.3019  ORF Transcript_2539/g.3019 Transcript_2539/m.3019 type:complete len:419 (-) Transcript_2539:293-1549(-)